MWHIPKLRCDTSEDNSRFLRQNLKSKYTLPGLVSRFEIDARKPRPSPDSIK